MKRVRKGSDVPEVVYTGQGTMSLRRNGLYALKGPEQNQVRYRQATRRKIALSSNDSSTGRSLRI
jgi:hypothetical protein